MEIDQIVVFAKSIWAEDLRQRTIVFARETRRLNEVMAARGIGASGTHVEAVFEASTEEIRVRAGLADEVLRKIVTESGSRPTKNELDGAYRTLITNMYQDIDRAWKAVLGLVPRGIDAHNAELRRLGNEQVRAIERQFIQVALFAESLQRPSSATPFTVHGNVGAIQTGAGATANVTFNIDAGAAEALQSALDALKDALGREPDAPLSIAAIATDIQSELTNPQRETKRIVALFAALSSAIGSIANAPVAWATVKNAAALIGMHLP